MKFKEMPLAHKYCIGKGIEIGAAAHNPFGLKDCINVAPREEEYSYRQNQVDICNKFAKIDYYAYAHKLPFEDSSYDYIISSHVLEHVPDVIGTLKEWDRVVRDGGIVFTIVPKRNALHSDVGRPLSVIFDFIAAHNKDTPNYIEGISRHTWIFSINVLTELVEFFNKEYNKNWEIVETEETDSKVGNGHTIVCRVHK